ncbi:MAG: HNH endonuclease [Fibrobacterota bacterium]|nr:MAG: HNH endonuclease [Fibrobacterota bacterium]
MNTWRMAMKLGNQGASLWPYFHEIGVAAITYYPVIRDDLSRYSKNNRPENWEKLEASQKGSLDHVAYGMKPGDVIYVKEGREIVSKGTVLTDYYHNTSGDILDDNDEMWPHRINVKWNDSFPRLGLLLGAEQTTVLKLSQERINAIESELSKFGWVDDLSHISVNQSELAQVFKEGSRFLTEQYFNKRNLELICRKKDQSEFICEICSFKFADLYGEIGEKYIEAHHTNMIANGERDSTLNDIALLCANCHSMVHRKTPPYTLNELKAIIETQRERRKLAKEQLQY